jgi:hypothetical protein
MPPAYHYISLLICINFCISALEVVFFYHDGNNLTGRTST